jgi:hypothetical protein
VEIQFVAGVSRKTTRGTEAVFDVGLPKLKHFLGVVEIGKIFTVVNTS